MRTSFFLSVTSGNRSILNVTFQKRALANKLVNDRWSSVVASFFFF